MLIIIALCIIKIVVVGVRYTFQGLEIDLVVSAGGVIWVCLFFIGLNFERILVEMGHRFHLLEIVSSIIVFLFYR